ncbi:unnamed protein product [Ectocarpus sp. 8 AP-2014]
MAENYNDLLGPSRLSPRFCPLTYAGRTPDDHSLPLRRHATAHHSCYHRTEIDELNGNASSKHHTLYYIRYFVGDDSLGLTLRNSHLLLRVTRFYCLPRHCSQNYLDLRSSYIHVVV